jgi:hypothetical protein
MKMMMSLKQRLGWRDETSTMSSDGAARTNSRI